MYELTYNCKVVIRDDAAEADAVLDAQLAANTIDRATAGEGFWAGTAEHIAERLAAFADLGFAVRRWHGPRRAIAAQPGAPAGPCPFMDRSRSFP